MGSTLAPTESAERRSQPGFWIVPVSLLLAVAGLSLLPVLGQALEAITSGPLRLGPLFAFVVAVSEISLLGLGALFWALVIGTAVSMILETDALREAR